MNFNTECNGNKTEMVTIYVIISKKQLQNLKVDHMLVKSWLSAV